MDVNVKLEVQGSSVARQYTFSIVNSETGETLFRYQGPHQLLGQTVTNQAIGAAIYEHCVLMVRAKPKS